ncbi:MAG: hypothetical protein M1156_01550 [Candidatus Marsarchaeota archaeon]|jgi:hypothetical protein|nr:hypothetical protein [Candidatus Marsarchaeota archaeon]
MSESVLGYIDNLTSFGIITPKRKSLVITDQRILVLDVSSVSTTAVSSGLTLAFGIFGRGVANSISKQDIEETTKKLSEEDLDGLLKSNAKNTELKNNDISAVEISRKQILIKAKGETLKYGFANPDTKNKESVVYDSYVGALQAALGGKVTAKR